MKKKNLFNIALITIGLSLRLFIESQPMNEREEKSFFIPDLPCTDLADLSSPYSYSDHEYRDDYDPVQNYSSSHYSYDYKAYHHNKRGRGYNGFNSDAQLHRRYDNSENFSSGISSYQGTSTGPGPNGGYPGTPRGTYKTYYYPQ